MDLVYEELQRISSQSEPTELTRFPILRDRMMEVVSALLKRCVGPTQMMVSNLVKIELAVSCQSYALVFTLIGVLTVEVLTSTSTQATPTLLVVPGLWLV